MAHARDMDLRSEQAEFSPGSTSGWLVPWASHFLIFTVGIVASQQGAV